MKIKGMMVGPLQTNMYIVVDEYSKEAVIIDPGDEANRAIDFITNEGLNLKGILVTHGHYDHIGAISEIIDFSKVPVFAHKNEAMMMQDARKNLSMDFSNQPVSQLADSYVEDNQEIELGEGLVFRCFEVPGHSSHSICYYNDKYKVLFTGDTLMSGTIGRMDLYDGPYGVLVTNIKDKLITLPGETTVYPGHGTSSTIEHERKYNPHLQG